MHNTSSSDTKSSVVKVCGVETIFAVAKGVMALLVVAACIDNYSTIFTWISFGKSYWAGITMTVTFAAVAFWCVCVVDKLLARNLTKDVDVFVKVGAAALFVSAAAAAASIWCLLVRQPVTLNVYEGVAALLMFMPIVVAILMAEMVWGE